METMNDTIKELAENSGASLAPVLDGREIVSIEVLNGALEFGLADGTRCAMEESASGNAIAIFQQHGALPPGGDLEGKRFFRRSVISVDGKRIIRFTEAGRDV